MPDEGKRDIQRRRQELDRRDSTMRTEALKAVSAQTRPLFRALQEECGKTGHRWKFDHYNWDRSYAWDACVWCDAMEGADRHQDANSAETGKE